MTKRRRHLDFLDEEQATELEQRLQKKKMDKNAIPKDIDSRQSILKITDKGLDILCAFRTRFKHCQR